MRIAHGALLCALLLCAPHAALAAAGVPQPEEVTGTLPVAQVEWIDSRGEVRSEIQWRVESAWVRITGAEGDPLGAGKSEEAGPKYELVHRTWFEVPPSISVERVEGDGLVYIPSPPDAPFSPADGARIAAIDTQSPSAEGTLHYKSATGTDLSVGLTVKFDFEAPFVWVDRSCRDQGLELLRQEGSARYLFVALFCEEGAGLGFQHSRDARVAGTTAMTFQAGGKNWQRFEAAPSGTTGSIEYLGRIQVAAKGKGAAAEPNDYVVLRAASGAGGRGFSFGNLGLGLTFADYREPNIGVSISEFGITGKISARYTFVPNLFDVHANAYATLFPLTHSPPNLPSARFFGINWRAGYRLPVNWAGGTWTLAGGFYFWGMIVSNQAYGAALLGGPQVLLSSSWARPGARSFYAYVKFAPISDTFELPSLKKREIAIGGGYELTSPSSGRRLGLTLDIASAAYSSVESGKDLGLLTTTIGVQTGL